MVSNCRRRTANREQLELVPAAGTRLLGSEEAEIAVVAKLVWLLRVGARLLHLALSGQVDERAPMPSSTLHRCTVTERLHFETYRYAVASGQKTRAALESPIAPESGMLRSQS